MLTQLSRHRATSGENLVDLLGDCHERIRRFITLAHEAGSRQDVPVDQIAQACIDVGRYFTQALPLHVADREESIEPRLRGLSLAVDQAFDAVTQQHRRHEPELEALLRATSVLRHNPHDGMARDEVANTALALEAQFENHLRLEESFPPFVSSCRQGPEQRSSMSFEGGDTTVDHNRGRYRPPLEEQS